MASLSLRFSESVRVLADATRRAGLVVPAFRSPPTDPDVDRSILRRPSGDIIVGVKLKDRPFAAVLADLIDAIIVVNEVAAADQGPVRRSLWAALAAVGFVE